MIASTASPFKFTRSVMKAAAPDFGEKNDFELADELSRIAHVKVPRAVEEIRTAKVLHNTVCEVSQMPETVKKFLKI